ncbi:esterase/lipase family protein [Nocardia sp. NBC_00511]|uniref:esterase/lipase family protein n=1 Tax=Nocardia sp. NBC_00511 TaxID=2903591 RepID=UPI0030DEE76C
MRIRKRLRAWGIPVALAATLLVVPTRAQALPAENPVLIVHGWTAHGALPLAADWSDAMRAALTADGHPVYVVDLPGELNIPNAEAISRVAQQASAEHGGARIDLVGHSMGGLSARYFAKFLDTGHLTAHYVSIGTGQYGWYPTCLLPSNVGGEMCPAGTFIRQLDHGDDTPGDVSYTTLRTSADDGDSFHTTADDLPLQGHSCMLTGIDGGPHADEPKNPTVIALILEALRGHCPGQLVDEPITE